MKRLHLLYIISITLLFSSCHLEMSHNGDLDGVWQMLTIENLQTGEVIDGRDVGSGLNWSFQGRLLMMRGAADIYVWRFDHSGETLKLYSPYFSGRFTEIHDDTPVTDATELNVYGVYRLEEYFKILQLDSNHMRLESPNVRLTFRKY